MGRQLSLNTAAKGDPGGAGAPGAPGTAGSGAQGLWQPSDVGALAWSVDPALASATASVPAGVIFLMRLKMTTTSTIGRVGLLLRSAAPAGLANTFVGVYSVAGATATRIGVSADISASVNGIANPTYFPLAAATASQPVGTVLLAAFLTGSGTTLPSMIGPPGGLNRFIAAKQDYRSITYGSSQTALPATLDLSSASASDGGNGICMTLGA